MFKKEEVSVMKTQYTWIDESIENSDGYNGKFPRILFTIGLFITASMIIGIFS